MRPGRRRAEAVGPVRQMLERHGDDRVSASSLGSVTSMLVLVRHAMPVLDPDIPAGSWELGAEGREATRVLARALPENPVLITSTETKARQTAEEIRSLRGGTLLADGRVVEVNRPHSWVDGYQQLARAYVASTQHAGWEAHANVIARFDAAVRDALEAASRRAVVVVSHGQAMTTWLARAALLTDPARFWSELTFPDAWQLTAPPGDTTGPCRLRRLTPVLEA